MFVKIAQIIFLGIFLSFQLVQETKAQDLELKAKIEKPENLSLTQAVQTAISSNLEIQSAFSKLPITEAKLIIAKYLPNPFISSFNEFVKGGSLQPIRLGTQIELGKKRHYRKEVAKEEIKKVALEIEKLTWEVNTKVHYAYAKLAIRQELFKLREEDELLEAERKLFQAKMELNKLLGKEPEANIIADGIETLKPDKNLLDSPHLTKIIKEAKEKRLEVALLEQEETINKALAKKLKWDRIPNITVQAAPVDTNERFGAFFGSFLTLPIFNRGQGEIQQVEARLDYLEKEKARIKQNIKFEIALAIKDLEIREKQIQEFEEDPAKKEEYLNSLLNYHLALANLESAVGVPLYNLSEGT